MRCCHVRSVRQTEHDGAGLEGSMLGKTHITPMLPIKDEARARHFYCDVLGLKADGREMLSTGYDTIGLYPSDEAPRSEHTALSFEVDDVPKVVDELGRRGVKFEDYDLPGLKTVNSVATIGAERCAWFKDSEGNL